VRRAAALTFLALLAAPTVGRAAACGKPDLLDTFPPDKAEGVPTNAVLSAHYSPTAEYLGEVITLEHVGVGSDTVKGTFRSTEGMVRVEPPDPLVEGDRYIISWPKLRGLDTAALGRGAEVGFTVGPGPDTESPRFDGLTGIKWDVVRSRDECTDALEERFRFDLTPGKAGDDTSAGSLALVVFQTKGPGIDQSAAPKPVLTTPLRASGDAGAASNPEPVSVELTVPSATGKVCFAALVRDLTGKPSGGAEKEVCTRTTAPPFFYGCRVAPAPSTPKTAPSGALAALALALFLRRRHRPAS
jgi:MYXO-CTERM domain-containing protein